MLTEERKGGERETDWRAKQYLMQRILLLRRMPPVAGLSCRAPTFFHFQTPVAVARFAFKA
ncbi:Hypothetical predicted protein [Podarcis lilfordi]|uniref:Uncharacterized protein n=1 Tax=Podarcis lilfordi TaxID=74358 RepID=A0AA35QQ26_9SAUR|nr:Hypothetical predicted protein [Podarcis lilfordi]